MQQPMPNPKDIIDPTTAMNMELVLMAKGFKLNYSTPTNNNQRISSNPRNRQITQPVQNPGVQNVRNQNGLIVVPGIANHNGNGNVVTARDEGIQLQAEEFDLMDAAADLDENEEVNANCILMANLQQASTSGTQTNRAPVYDSDRSTEVHHLKNCYNDDIFNMCTQEEQYTELLEPIPEPHQVQQNNSNVISEVSSVEQDGGTAEQHPAIIEETRSYFESIYNNLSIEVEKVNTVNRMLRETNADLTTELARYKNQKNFDMRNNIQSIENSKTTLEDKACRGHLPSGKKAIGTKWVFKNKRDERSIVVKNKARLIAQGFRQEEGIDYDEVFAPVARIEAIRLFLAFASYMGFTVYQMDVKSAFLYGTIEEEVYVHQPPGFVDPAHPNKVYKVIKALYGLHQAPRAWYETLSSFLMENGFRRGTIDKTLFIKKKKSDIMLVQVYVDDIIFGSTKKSLCTEFEDCMHKRFQMSSMGELTFFLGLQVKQQPDGIFISQDKYVADILKKFDFWSIRTASTPIESNKPLVKDEDGEDVDVHVYRSMIGSLMYLTASRPDIMFVVCACARFQVTLKASYLNAVKLIFRYLKHQPKLGLWYPRDSPFELEAFSDSDYGGASLDRKSTTDGSAKCCGQVLWIQNQMMDYGFNFMNTRIHIDNESTISVIKNPVAHSRTKHIEIQFHFIRDCYEKRLIEVIKIHTDSNVADLLTKGFDVTRFIFLVVRIGMLNLYITATVASKPVSISEASIRSDLQFNDAVGIDVLSNQAIFDTISNQAIFDTIQLMGVKSVIFMPSLAYLAKESHVDMARSTREAGFCTKYSHTTNTRPHNGLPRWQSV
ncbi:putative ribonuclease H-like domain-containing protein [Tanacetum coccineum]|uniref:Ribonuclease H-like domain-containing protein n=1 Tax=Tanacetum coccineum TaxID=301880 RepID=A0ABQ5B433_9ASTR